MAQLGDKYLIPKRNVWWFRRAIPTALRPAFGGQANLLVNLKTSDIRVAKRRRDETAIDVDKLFRRAAMDGQEREHAALRSEAELWSKWESTGEPDDPLETAKDAALERLREHDERHGTSYGDVMLGRRAVDDPLDEHLAEGAITDKTKNERRKEIGEFASWVGSHGGGALPTLPRRTAALFFTAKIVPLNRKTAAKKLSHLRVYWSWLLQRGYAEGENPWKALELPAESSRQKIARKEAAERAFSDDEMQKLFYGPRPGGMRDIDKLDDAMRVAALSGMRIEEMCGLTIADCADSLFTIRVGKTESATRRVPIHPDLASIVARRSKGKAKTDRLFSDVVGQGASLSDPLSKQFGRFIRHIKVADLREGHRRSKVNFHSFRRWFVTQADQADQPPHIISSVVGHAEGRQGMTLGTYSAGSSAEQMRRCVEAVKFPKRKAAP